VAKSSSSSQSNAPSADGAPQPLAHGPVQLSSLINRLTRPVLGNRGFAGADIIGHWTTIVGPDLAALACPLSLKYERGSQRQGATVGATLVVRVTSGAAATLLQFKSPQVIDRVNRYFGYQAIAKLHIALGILPKAARAINAAPTPPSPEAAAAIDRTVAEVGSPALRLALAQLGANVRRRSTSADTDLPREIPSAIPRGDS
jgi:hypothetical protein